MAWNPAQGSGIESGAPRSAAPAPGPLSATADRLTQLESGFDEVRQHNFPVLSDIIESTRAEVEELRKTVEYRRNEVGAYARVEELNELRRMLNQHVRQCAGNTS